jgi:hypothetical protein
VGKDTQWKGFALAVYYSWLWLFIKQVPRPSSINRRDSYRIGDWNVDASGREGGEYIMSFLETTIAIIIAQVPTYFIQRYFFKGVMDKHLDNIENKFRNGLKKQNENRNQLL